MVVDVNPVPLRLAPMGELVALLVTARVPEAAPPAVGVKVTFMVHDAPPANVLPQLLGSAKGPLVTMEEIVMELWPGLVKVVLWAEDVEPTFS